jgi:Family of unknown function (DUF6577)
MKWKQEYLVKLKDEFSERPFTANEAKNIGDYSLNVVNNLLGEFVKRGNISRTGRGVYVTRTINQLMERNESNPEDEIDSPVAKRATEVLAANGVDNMATGPTVLAGFANLLPFRSVHLIYVQTGEGEKARDSLERVGIKSIVDPKGTEDVERALSLVDGDLIVLRQTKGLMGKIGNFACVERALVDLYFESTRRKIPVPVSEVGRVMGEALNETKINVTRMTKIASRRGIDREIRGILVGLGSLPPNENRVMNDDVKRVIMAAER